MIAEYKYNIQLYQLLRCKLKLRIIFWQETESSQICGKCLFFVSSFPSSSALSFVKINNLHLHNV